jgi:hypothetical protein
MNGAERVEIAGRIFANRIDVGPADHEFGSPAAGD